MKTNCPAGCGKRFIDAQSAENHMKDQHAGWAPKRKGWATPYGFGDWSEAITYEDACARMKEIQESIAIKWPDRGFGRHENNEGDTVII